MRDQQLHERAVALKKIFLAGEVDVDCLGSVAQLIDDLTQKIDALEDRGGQTLVEVRILESRSGGTMDLQNELNSYLQQGWTILAYPQPAIQSYADSPQLVATVGRWSS